MPLVSGSGPRWSRPLVKTADERLSGLNPIRTFLARLFGRDPARFERSRRPLRDPDDGGASAAGVGAAAKKLGD